MQIDRTQIKVGILKNFTRNSVFVYADKFTTYSVDATDDLITEGNQQRNQQTISIENNFAKGSSGHSSNEPGDCTRTQIIHKTFRSLSATH
ncbi:hypothetical protein BH10CYA1_BH10CYA1_34740 [soil metagenome]